MAEGWTVGLIPTKRIWKLFTWVEGCSGNGNLPMRGTSFERGHITAHVRAESTRERGEAWIMAMDGEKGVTENSWVD